MKHIVNGLALLLLCFSLALAGCSTDPDPMDSTAPGAPRGRYVEQELSPPENIASISGIHQFDDGSIWLMGFAVEPENRSARGGSGEYKIWSSTDGGDSWQEQAYPWLEEIPPGHNINDAAFASPDSIYIYTTNYGDPSDEQEQAPSEDGEDGGEPAPEDGQAGEAAEDADENDFFDYSFTYHLFHGDREQLTELEPERWPLMTADLYGSPYSIDYTDAGLLLNYYNHVNLHAIDSGREQFSIDVEGDATWGNHVAFGNQYALVQQGSINLYDLASGELLRELPYTSADLGNNGYTTMPERLTALALDKERTALYYCNATGLYRMTLDGGVTEKLMDGDLTSLALPTLYMQYLYPREDGSFLVICSEREQRGLRFFRYVFDPDVSSVPGTEIKVYSLEDNQTVRQAIGQMQTRNPDMKVNYQVGVTGDDGTTAADALRTLSTELLAGSGPDILVLDDLPVDSYIQKGVLQDLSGLLDEKIASGELLQNVADTFRRDGALYAVPARFSVPTLQGTDIGSIGDLSALADRLRGGELKINTPANIMMQRFYPILSGGWFRADGALDEASFRRDLALLRELADPAEEQRRGYDEINSVPFGSLAIKGQMAELAFGVINTVSDLAGPYSLFVEAGEGELQIFPGTDGGIFLPRTILGVNAASASTDLAQQFVALVLSEEVLTNRFDDGLAVHAGVLDKGAEYSDDERGVMSVGTSIEDPETGEYISFFLMCDMPEDRSVITEWNRRFAALGRASYSDIVLRQMFIDETAGYFADEQSLDEAVGSLKGKLDLYLAE